MDYSTLLLEFIDGTLDNANEQALFATLSSNEELRNELKHLLAISSSVHNDTEAFIPQTASTQRIFTELGFTPPLPVPTTTVGTSAATATTVASSSTVSLVRRFLPAVGSAVAASLATAGILWGIFRPTSSSTIANTPQTEQHPALPARTATLERILAHQYNAGGAIAQVEQRNDAHTEGVREVVRYVYVPQETPITPEQTTIQPDKATDITAPIAFSQLLSAPTSPVITQELAKNPPPSQVFGSNSVFAMPWHISDDAALLVEISNTVSESFPNATVEPASSSWLHNKAVSVLYPITDNQSLGITFGEEPFFQRFEARNDAGRRYQYEQNPVLPWAGVTYRYSLPNLGVFSPFGQFMLGGTQVGALGRTVVGFTYSPNAALHLMAGVNGSLLYYPIQNTWYSSSKLGLVYGIGIAL